MPRLHVLCPAIGCVLGALAATPLRAWALDSAPVAERVGPEALEPEPPPRELDVSIGARWTHVAGRASPDTLPGLTNVETAELTSRLLLGSTFAYCAGLDAHAGGSDTGAAYGATLTPVGVGVRGARGAFVALCGGAGGDRTGSSVPWGYVFPAELSFGLSLGPLRPVGFARATWVAGAPERRSGSPTLSFVDELEAGLSIRVGAQRRYWKETSAGAGPAVGAFYSEFMGARAVSVTLTFDLSGAR